MNKQMFIDELSHYLKQIPTSDRTEIIKDFEEHFEVGIQEGKTEEEIAQELGNPKVIAEDVLTDYNSKEPVKEPQTAYVGEESFYSYEEEFEKEKQAANVTRSIIATIGLVLFNLIFIVGPVAGIFGVYVGLFAVGAGFTLSPVAWGITITTGHAKDLLAELFIVMTLCSLGVLLSIAMIYVGKFLYRIFIMYVKLNVRIIKG